MNTAFLRAQQRIFLKAGQIMISPFKLAAVAATSLLVLSIGNSAWAARTIGANPDHELTVAERALLQKLFQEGKIKVLFSDHANRLEGIELEKFLKNSKPVKK